ncbi:MAG TPA: hypothetical protein VNT79_03010 [Phycisphaerae bacterium]|nr:hypothetical protein [Phycisphaerae bacterium]
MKNRGDCGLMVIAMVAGLAGAASVAPAQTLTGRYSQVNYSYVFGAGGDSHSGGENLEEFELLATDNLATDFEDYTEGVLPGDPETPYTAGVECEISQEYEIMGALDAFQSISASASSEVTAAESGAGVASMDSSNGGNLIQFNFTVDQTLEYRFSGSVSSTQPGFFTSVAIQRFDGITWQWWFNTGLTPNPTGPFDIGGDLNPGDYRLIAQIANDSFGNEHNAGSYFYTLSLTREGDMNCDGRVDGEDVQGFVWAIVDPGQYDAVYEECNPLNGDMNDDQFVTFEDTEDFVNVLLN